MYDICMICVKEKDVVNKLNTIDFQDYTENGISLVKFEAGWCSPCKRYTPTFNAFAERNLHVKCFSVDAELETGLCSEFNISSIPVTLLFKDGELIEKKQGILSEEQLLDLVKSCE
jgi:thioredoxin 1